MLAILDVPGGKSAVCVRHELAYGLSTDAADLKDFTCAMCDAEATATMQRERYRWLVAAADLRQRAKVTA